jgi:hypothetical protein
MPKRLSTPKPKEILQMTKAKSLTEKYNELLRLREAVEQAKLSSDIEASRKRGSNPVIH